MLKEAPDESKNKPNVESELPLISSDEEEALEGFLNKPTILNTQTLDS